MTETENGIKKFINNFKKIILTKTSLNLSCFLMVCLFFLVIDIIAKYIYYNKTTYLPSQNTMNFLINTRDLLKNSFIELLLSQISITFLVTSLLSIFGSNEKLIFWENAIEYKLIKPQGQSFKDITIYCLATLPLSVIAIVFRLYLLFILSFSVNIIGLTVITIKMFTIYFDNEKICTELKHDFFALKTDEERLQKLCQLEANTYRHIQNNDLTGISQNTNFLKELTLQKKCSHLVFPHVLRIYVALPAFSFPDTRQTLLRTALLISCPWIADRLETPMLYSNVLLIEGLIQDKIRSSIQSQKKLNIPHIDTVEKIRQECFNIINSYTASNSIPSVQLDEFLCFYETLVIQKPLKTVLSLMYTPHIPLPKLIDSLDFGETFSKSVTLMKLAYKNNCNLTPYLYSLRRIYRYLVHTGLETLEDEGLVPITRAHNSISVDTTKSTVPNSIMDVVNCFSEKSALTLFEILCDDQAIHSDKDILLSILTMVYNTTKPISKKTTDQMYNLLKNSTILHTDDLLKALKSNHI